MTRPTCLLLGSFLALSIASPVVHAHDGGVLTVLATTLAATVALGVLLGGLGGWFKWRASVSTLLAIAFFSVTIGVIELVSVSQRPLRASVPYEHYAEDFFFLSMFAIIPFLIAYAVAHATGAWVRKRAATIA